ncbi:hypothetical protein V1515DRAFT_530121 [Lipomyces mesembrius]
MRTFATGILLRPATSRPSFVLARHYADLMRPRPGPPRLPQEEQDEFERLLEKANEGTFVPKKAPEQPESEALENPAAKILKTDGAQSGGQPAYAGRTIPEFEGDVNPKTGEIGGPKQDPLRHGDYSFNGRVTDF